jgi:tryptophanyl-tRNA synthetase
MSAPPAPPRPRILSGIQPSGRLHLGNYFGAIKQHVELQEQGECFYFIANLHSLTTLRDPEQLLENTREVALTYLAFGLDPQRSVFYRQSDVPEVTELTWLLATVTSMGLLERAHSYKEKVAKGIMPTAGLFLYPALMAADILAPRADLVPVGKDQDQHVEMARDMAELFNNAFPADPPVFALPRARFSETPRVPGTTFEKGSVLQVNTELAVVEPFDRAAYVASVRERVRRWCEAAPDAVLGTEALEAHLAAAQDGAAGSAGVLSRALRTLAEMPAGDWTESRNGQVLTLEFCVELPRVVFVTRDGKRVAAKMSKSYGNTIDLATEGKALRKSVMGIETRLVDLADPLDPEEDLVMQLYRLFATQAEVAEMTASYRAGGFGYGRAKQALLAKIEERFAPYRARRAELARDPDRVEDALREGGRRARALARETLERARAACGIPRLPGA